MSAYYLGFDFGTTKIGVAVGQRVTRTASPLTVIAARDGKPDWAALDPVIKEWQPEALIVGLPLNMDDTSSDMSAAAEKFSRRLFGRYSIPTEMMDERLSTFEAKSEDPNGDVDAVAARLILESWLSNLD